MRSTTPSARGYLIRLAAEGVAPLVGGCAGVVVGGPAGAMAGVLVGKAAEEAVKYFGPCIVQAWLGWFSRQPASLQASAVAAVAELTPAEARATAEEALKDAVPDAKPEDLELALDYLTAIPAAVRRSLVADRTGGGLSVPATMALNNGRQLLGLLPTSIPPYRADSDLPGTPYRLQELLGAGGFGAVYKATTPTLQHLAFAIKFCLDHSLFDALKRERANLDRLQSVQAARPVGAERIVRLYGYDFDHATPYLVYEFVPGSDLAAWLAGRRESSDNGLPADEAFALITQVAEALAFAHEKGLVHRDLKPANVLYDGAGVKLTDFGIGSVTAAHAATHSRIGATTIDQLDAAEQATLFRGAGTALYMSPEQRRGEPPDPRHDLFSLGVMWYQLLVGDVSRELTPGWADELIEDHGTPAAHVEMIRACIGVLKKRPENAAKLLELLRAKGAAVPVAQLAVPEPPRLPPVMTRANDDLTAKAPHLREELARGIVAAQVARRRDWRFGLWLTGVLVSSILGVPTLIALLLLTTSRSRGDRETFTMMFGLLFPLVAAGVVTAVLMWRARLARQLQTRGELANAIDTAQPALGVPPLTVGRDNHDTLCQTAWALVRDLEERHVPRHVVAQVRYAGVWGWDSPIRVYLDGHFLGEGGRRRGFELPAQLCRGTHLLELRQEQMHWIRPFVTTRDGPCRVEVGNLDAGAKVEVVGSY